MRITINTEVWMPPWVMWINFQANSTVPLSMNSRFSRDVKIRMGTIGLMLLTNIFAGIRDRAMANRPEHPSHCQSQRLLGHKQHDDEQGGKDDLEPGIQPVDHTFAGKVLPQGNVLQHVPSPPFSFRYCSSISFAYATVYTWLSNR